MSTEFAKPQSAKSGCLIAAALILGFAVLAVGGGLFLIKRSLSDFDSHRETMGIRTNVVVTNEHLRYSPGFDAAMWCRFTVTASGLDKVFDTSRVNTAEFSQVGYQFRVDWINDDWWDVERHDLIGGEVQVGGDFMRVAYRNNGDGTLTVYVFWFEV